MSYKRIDGNQVGRFIERMGMYDDRDYRIVARFMRTINDMLELI